MAELGGTIAAGRNCRNCSDMSELGYTWRGSSAVSELNGTRVHCRNWAKVFYGPKFGTSIGCVAVMIGRSLAMSDHCRNWT